jgi:hypothetical protein
VAKSLCAKPFRVVHSRGPRGALLGFVALGCMGAPRSQFPDAESALSRMKSEFGCSRGLQIEAKADYFESSRRVRGNLAIIAALPESIRIDVFSPFGVDLSTLTSDGRQFSLYELQSRKLWWGTSSACNLARFTRISLPPFVLVQLLRGEAPILKHVPNQASIRWSSNWLGTGHYEVQITGNNQSSETIQLVPESGDWSKPWDRQRLHVTDVAVWQAGRKLYQVMLEGHSPTKTAAPREDPDGLDPPILSSGPSCTADVPRRIRFISPESDTDFVLSYTRVEHNPPLVSGVFEQPVPGGVLAMHSECTD